MWVKLLLSSLWIMAQPLSANEMTSELVREKVAIDWQRGLVTVKGRSAPLAVAATVATTFKGREQEAWADGRGRIESAVQELLATYQNHGGSLNYSELLRPAKQITIYSRNTIYHSNGAVDVQLEGRLASLLDLSRLGPQKEEAAKANAETPSAVILKISGKASPLPWFEVCDSSKKPLFTLADLDRKLLGERLMASWWSQQVPASVRGGNDLSLDARQEGLCLVLEAPSKWDASAYTAARQGKLMVQFR